MHKDEPIDLGGFSFCEVFFGSDMARVACIDSAVPATFWLAAVDAEESRGVYTLCVLLPSSNAQDRGAADTTVDASLSNARTCGDAVQALRQRGWGACAAAVADMVAELGG